LKGTTFDGEKVADPPLAGDTTTCVAVMVVPLVVPSTRTGLPVVTALAEVELVPFRYVVEDAVFTVTFSPADVDTVKPDVDTLLTVPTVPPAAGPDRALDPAFAVLLLEPESAIAMTATTTTTTAMPAAMDAVSLCLLKILGPRVMAVHPFSVGARLSQLACSRLTRASSSAGGRLFAATPAGVCAWFPDGAACPARSPARN
jgi:hypothetical protein